VLRPVVQLHYLMLHKPAGYVTTASDPQGRPTVMELVPAMPRLYPVGRLDLDTEGLLLLTNDGPLAHRLTHPRYGVPKLYRAKVAGLVVPEALERLRTGVLLDDGPTAPARVRLLRQETGTALLELELKEGRKRQVRRMCAAVGHPVLHLRRAGFGPLRLGRLPKGAYRPLTPDEVARLRRAAHLSSRGAGPRQAPAPRLRNFSVNRDLQSPCPVLKWSTTCSRTAGRQVQSQFSMVPLPRCFYKYPICASGTVGAATAAGKAPSRFPGRTRL